MSQSCRCPSLAFLAVLRLKTRGHFPSDGAASKLIWLALRNIMAKWRRSTHHWKAALNQFAILYADRFNPASAA